MAATLSQDRAAAPPVSSSPTTTAGDVRLHVLEFNRRGEEGIPVVILHGLLGQGRNFRSWGMALHERLARPRRVLIPDLRNHGSSGHADDMTYQLMAQDVLAMLDRHGIDRAVLVGHSMGGKVAAGKRDRPGGGSEGCMLTPHSVLLVTTEMCLLLLLALQRRACWTRRVWRAWW